MAVKRKKKRTTWQEIFDEYYAGAEDELYGK